MRRAMGRFNTKAMMVAGQSTGGRALEVYNLLRAQGDIDEGTQLEVEAALDSGDNEEFTRIMGQVGVQKFGSAGLKPSRDATPLPTTVICAPVSSMKRSFCVAKCPSSYRSTLPTKKRL